MKQEISLQIDGRVVSVTPGTTVLEAAEKLGIVIPTMCHYQGLENHTSCMVCMVRDERNGAFFASCSMPASEGMDIKSNDQDVLLARKTALELLLSEHIGDCQAPCQLACPAHMDIPLMNRLLAAGQFSEAYAVVMNDIPLPGVLGRICAAPCEKACKRKDVDMPVSICLLKRFAGDEGILHYAQKQEVESRNQKVLVVGSGPAGLTAAYMLRRKGYDLTLYEREFEPGGNLRHPDLADRLPLVVLTRETDLILSSGIKLVTGVEVKQADLQRLAGEYDAIILAAGENLEADQPSIMSARSGASSRMAIQAIAKGKEAALKADQYLLRQLVTGEHRRFNSRTGKLTPADFEAYLMESTPDSRHLPDSISDGFTRDQVMAEAARCMHCDCRKQNSCKLRDYSEHYGANQRHYNFSERKAVSKQLQRDLVVYEPGKCIKCGICVRITRKYQEKFGLTFIGRGFDVEIQVPFREALGAGLAKTALEVAEACPTGAISPLKTPSS